MDMGGRCLCASLQWMWSTVRYSALPQEDPIREEDEYEEEHIPKMEFGVPEGTFGPAFTYANYNDLDKMGYQAPKRFGQSLGNRYGPYTYAHHHSDDEIEVKPMNIVELLIYSVSVLLAAVTLPFSLLFVLKFVSTSERLVVLRLGRAQKTRGPGPTFVLPCIDSTHRISTSVSAFNVPPLQIITSDRGLVELGATVFLKIRNPLSAVCEIQDRNNSTRTLANTMLYRYISKKRVCEISNPQDRRIIAANLKDELGSFTGQFGVEITNVEMSDVKIIKDGENMGMAALNSVAKSETGQQLWNIISPHVEEYTRSVNKDEPSTSSDSAGPSTSSSSSSSASIKEEPPLFDVDHLLTHVNLAIDEHLTRAVGRVFQINCANMEPIYVDLKHPPGLAAKGTAQNPDVVFETSQRVFYSLLKKETSPVNAYMDGSLKVKGSIQDALSLKYLAERVSLLL